MASTSGAGPLTGIRVVELANFLSGPFATMQLSDLGAEVIKIETAKGDPFRRLGKSNYPESPLFVNSNHGKRSVALDLKSDDGRAKAFELISGADVMVTNWRPGVTDRLGLADDALAAANPQLIRVYVTGFGATGPSADRATYDAIIQAHLGSASGLMPGQPPAIQSLFVIDKISATMVCQATLAALFGRERGAGGTRIDLSLLEAGAYVQYPDMMANRTFIEGSPAEAANTHAAATRPIQATDGWLIVVPVTAQQIRAAFEVIGDPELGEQIMQVRDAAELTVRMLDALEVYTRNHSVAECMERFLGSDVPCGACLTFDQHLDDPQVRHNDNYQIADWPHHGQVRYIRYPARFSAWPEPVVPGAPPRPGQDNDAILSRTQPVT